MPKELLKSFLTTCIVDYDTANYYTNIAFLKDEQGVNIASFDYQTNSGHCDQKVYITDDTAIKLNKEDVEFIYSYIDEQTEELRNEKRTIIDDAYDVSNEQDLYN